MNQCLHAGVSLRYTTLLNKKTFSFLILGLLTLFLFSITIAATAGDKPPVISTEANKIAEITLTAKRKYADPFNQVMLDAVFTDPSGKTFNVPGFWAGGDTWKIRYSSAVTGTHTFNTVCSEAGDKGLQGIKGSVTVNPYSGSNALYQHGALKIASDKRHFAYGDGTPFFWLGDTWWMGLTKRLRYPEDVQLLAGDRIRKGFNVVQIIAGLYPDMPAFDPRGENEAGFPWEPDYKSIRPAYFDDADKKIFYLAEQGIVPCIVGAWGYHLPWLGVDKMKQHWRYLIARWGALPVVWCAAGETTMPFYLSTKKKEDEEWLRKEWTNVIAYLKDTDPYKRIVSTHAAHHDRSTRFSITRPELLDFDMHQSGHGNGPEKQAAQALEAWRMQPVMPVMSGESRYEALAIPKPLPASAPRQAFWAHTVNSGLAGHTYGANGIWQLNGINQPYGNSPGGNNWGITPWNEAMNLPGSAQIGAARAIIESVPQWNTFEPRPEGISNWSQKDTALFAVTAAGAGLAYLPSPGTIKLRLPKTGVKYTAYWFDPVTTKKLEQFALVGDSAGDATATSPTTQQDWVLVLWKNE